MKGVETPSFHIFSSYFWDQPWPVCKSSLENTVAEICTNSELSSGFTKVPEYLEEPFLQIWFAYKYVNLNYISDFVKNNLNTSSRFLLLQLKMLSCGHACCFCMESRYNITDMLSPSPPHSTLFSFPCPLFRKPSSCCWAATKTYESPSSKAERNLMWRFSDLHL